MRTVTLAVLAVLLAVVPARADADAELVARTITLYEQIESTRTEMNDKLGDLPDTKRAYELALYELQNTPKTEEQLDELARDIKKQKQTLKQLRADNGSKPSINYSKRRIRDLSLIYQANQAGTDEQKQAFRDKVQPKIDQISQKIAALEAPFHEKIKALEASAATDNQPLGDLLTRYVKTPEQAYPGASIHHLNANANMAFGSCHWQDADGKQIAWAHVRIRSLDEIEDYHREQLLDDIYPIQALSDNSLWVWAGHFLVTFVVDDESLQGKDAVRRAIHDFVDLEGLASILAETEKAVVGAVE